MSARIAKVGGAAGITAGAVIVAEGVWEIVAGRIHEGVVESAVHALWVLLLIGAVVDLHAGQAAARSRFEQVATVVTLVGMVTLFVLSLPEAFTHHIDGPDGKLPPVTMVAMVVSMVCYIGGMFLLAAASWRLRIVPRAAFVLLVLVLGILAMMFLGETVRGTLVPFGIAWAWIGFACLAPRRPAVSRATGIPLVTS